VAAVQRGLVTLVTVDVPDGTPLDGAVVELSVTPDGRVVAEVRIPAPAATGYEDSTSFNSSI